LVDKKEEKVAPEKDESVKASAAESEVKETKAAKSKAEAKPKAKKKSKTEVSEEKPKKKSTKVTEKTAKAESAPAEETKPSKVESSVEEEKKSDEKAVEKESVPVKEEKAVTEKKPAPKPVAKPVHEEWAGNPMLVPVIEKVTVNMSVGKSGGPLDQAVTIIKQLTNQTPSKRRARKTIREFGIRKGEPIACVVTLRDEPAKEFLNKAFYAIENKLSKFSFDPQGNFSFGIKEHINLPGTRYLPELGIHGMDVSVSLGRAGYRVKRRHRRQSKIGKDHLLTAKEAILFIKDEFDVEIQ